VTKYATKRFLWVVRSSRLPYTGSVVSEGSKHPIISGTVIDMSTNLARKHVNITLHHVSCAFYFHSLIEVYVISVNAGRNKAGLLTVRSTVDRIVTLNTIIQ